MSVSHRKYGRAHLVFVILFAMIEHAVGRMFSFFNYFIAFDSVGFHAEFSLGFSFDNELFILYCDN